MSDEPKHPHSDREYKLVNAASSLHHDSGAWTYFMREIVRLPLEMSPAVYQVLRLQMWRGSPNPLEIIREEAIEAHRRAWAGRREARPSDG
jgi:hypothetical protein